MSDIDIEIEIDSKSIERVLDKIQERAAEGAEKGLNDTLSQGQSTAKDLILQQRSPYTTPHLHSSFEHHTLEINDELKGFITNPLEYAAYVDQGVSGTERQRDTPFEYTDSMPPLEEMIKFVKERMGGWDINDSPPFETFENSFEYHRKLADYDVPSNFRKERITNTNQLAEKVEVFYDNGDNTYRGYVDELDEENNTATIIYTDLSVEVDLDSETELNEIYAREDRTYPNELEEGDYVIYSERYSNNDIDRPLYGRVVDIRDGGEDSKQIVVEDVFKKFDTRISISSRQTTGYIGTRDENRDKWASEIILASSPPEDYKERFQTPDSFTEQYRVSLLNSVNTEVVKNDAVIEDQNGDLVEVNLKEFKGSQYNYEFFGGFDEDGNTVSFKFDNVSEIPNKNWSVEGVPNKLVQWDSLEKGDEYIIDLDRELIADSEIEDKWNFDADARTKYVRVKVEEVTTDSSGFKQIRVQTHQAPSAKLKTNFRSFITTRSEDPAVWNAKTLQIGDKVTVTDDRYDGIQGRFLEDQNLYNKSYQVGRFKIFSEEEGIVRVRATDLDSITKDSDWRNEEPIPDSYTLPNKFESESLSLVDDPEEDVEYYAWDYRKGRFITVEWTGHYNTWRRVGGNPDKPYAQGSYEEETYKIKIVGKEVDQTNASHYDIPVPTTNQDESTETSLSAEWHEYLGSTDKSTLKTEISDLKNINADQAEVLQAYLTLTTDDKIPQVGSETTFDPSLSDFVDFVKGSTVSTSEKDTVVQAFDRALQKEDPVTSAHVLASLDNVQAQNFSNESKTGDHNAGLDRIRIGAKENTQQIKDTMVHEVGHHVHHMIGIGSDYSKYNGDNFNKQPKNWELGIDTSVISDDSYDTFTLLEKAWETYKQYPNDKELRSYQKKHGIELLAVSYRYYINNPEHVKRQFPSMYLLWESETKNEEIISDFDEIETGSEIILDVFGDINGTPYTVQSISTNDDGDTVLEMENGKTFTRYQLGKEWEGLK